MLIQELKWGIKRIQLGIGLVNKLPLFILKFNIYAITTKSGITLFDCGPEVTTEALKSVLGNERIYQIFLTHAHADHAGSSQYWLKEGVNVFTTESECRMLRSGGPEDAPKTFRYPGTEPTGTVQPGDIISLDDEFLFTVIPTPGHTSGSCCYYDSEKNILITGDLFYGPCKDYITTFLLELLTSQKQPKVELKRQIEAVKKLVNDGLITNSTLILPGHGPVYYLRQKPNTVKRSLRLLRACLLLK